LAGQVGTVGAGAAAFEFVAVSAPQPAVTSATTARVESDASFSFFIYSR
jgi:hypothetical protein